MDKVTVITVTYNCEKVIEETIQNVLSQDYPNIEYIIVDGASKDGTLGIINGYRDRITKIVSEPDNGVYDAMNKAVKLATGEWINFMNAGDCFEGTNTISKLFKNNHDNAGIVFGDTLSLSHGVETLISYRAKWWKHKLMPSCHQSIFVRRGILESYPFDLTFRVAADVDSFNRMRKAGVIFDYVPIIVARYDASEGISQNPQHYYRELYSIRFENRIMALLLYKAHMFKLRCAKVFRSIGLLPPPHTPLPPILRVIGRIVYKTHCVLDSAERQYLRCRFMHVGTNTHIGHGGLFTYENINIGDNCHIGKMACLQSAHGKIIIGNNVMLGPYVSIHGGDHLQKIGVFLNGTYKEAGSDGNVEIEDNVWVGANSVILKSVCIKRGTIVAAGAVVRKNTAPYSVVGGIPAKHIKFYWTIEQILEHESKLYPKMERYTREQLEEFFRQYERK